KRHITCHSYVQSEITMLMRVAEEMGFRINTFTHILEGYKVADKMKKHGAAGSTFADWWAYKYEVIDAIPHNPGLMHQEGVTVGINSDDAEMARRLNQEAAKSVKYAGVSEEDAWKFVTLNPAKMLRVDDRVGSLDNGKDADIVVWNNNPLSIYAVPEKTFVDGRLYFDKETDARLQIEVDQERSRLLQKMIADKKGGAPAIKPVPQKKIRYHCVGEE
ncbi:MAG TPA: amidohydrolase family protein, partial [bacterium]|nr:amidohydrolase family protein [bacterium]